MEDSEPWETATFRGNIIIQISIKIQFKSYLLIEYIRVTQFVVSHLFHKRGKGVLNFLNAWWSLSVLFRLALSSPGLDTSRLGPVLGALHYSKPVLWLRLGGLEPKETESWVSAPGDCSAWAAGLSLQGPVVISAESGVRNKCRSDSSLIRGQLKSWRYTLYYIILSTRASGHYSIRILVPRFARNLC